MNTHPLPYFAVIFISKQSSNTEGYETMAEYMESLAEKQEGFLGIESARNDIGITVSYWKSMEAISKWKAHLEHQKAQQLGKTKWYESYRVRICKVEREYSFESS